VVAGGDEGRPVVTHHPDSPSARAITAAARRLMELVPPPGDETCTARAALLAEHLDARRNPSPSPG
jgi:hypothetical protein